MIPGLLTKVLDDEAPKMIDFDTFVRLVAIILEENNVEVYSEDEFAATH